MWRAGQQEGESLPGCKWGDQVRDDSSDNPGGSGNGEGWKI